MQSQQKQKKLFLKQEDCDGGGYSQLMSGFSQQQLHQEDSMQCSEVMTVNQTNGLITSKQNHNLSANSDQQINHNNNNNNLGSDRKDHEKKTMQALQKEFDIMQFNYANEEFSFQINRLCKRISSEKHASDIACKFPLYKMIRSIVKKFLLNELELLFFGYVLEESKWKVDDIEVRKHAYYMNDFLNITEVKDVLDYKAVLLYLILTAYGVKFYLNEETDMVVFGAHMNTIVKDFAGLFQYWSKNYGSTSFKIVPKSLNRVYRNLSKKPTDSNKRQHEDYNALVDAIIQISPPYNNEKALNTTTTGNASSSNNNSELGDCTVKQMKLEKGSTRNITGNGNTTTQQNLSNKAGTNLNNNQSNYVPQDNQLLKKIVEKKQQQQQVVQQQGLPSVKVFSNQNQGSIQQGGLNSTIIGYQQQQQQFQQQQQQQQQQQKYPSSSPHISKHRQSQQQILDSQRVDFSGNFGNNNGSIHLQNINPINNIPSGSVHKNHNPNSIACSGSNKNSHPQPINSNINNNNNISISSTHTSQHLRRENSLLQGLTGTNGFNTDQLDFLNNNNIINRPSSNNNFNFNHSYSSLAMGGGYQSFLQTIPQTNNNLTGINNDIEKPVTKLLNQLTNNLHNDTNNINIINNNNNNFGLQSSGGSFDNPIGTAGISGNNPLGGFNTATMAFSNGFIGQNHNNINININNSFTSNQAGFNNNNNIYSQFQGTSSGQQNQPSLQNLLFPTHQKKTKQN